MNKKKTIIIALVAIVVLVLIIVFGLNKSRTENEGSGQRPSSSSEDVPEAMLENQSEEAAGETQKLIDEIIGEESELDPSKIITIGGAAEVEGMEGEEGSKVVPIQAVAIAPGNSLVDINSGDVIRDDGTKVDNAAKPASQEAPSQSFPLDNPDDLPSSTIKLDVTSSSFTPNTFTVKRGQVVTLAITNTNTSTFSEVFRFDDESLKAVVVGLAKGQTKSIVFNAPTTAGEYAFYSSMFNHREMGAEGKMIVE
jgi:plastocyanin